MDRSPDEDPTTVATPQSGRRSTRRRLVQSTLFSPKPLETQCHADLEGDNEECSGAVENGQDGERCGSQDKKKRARKGKATPPQSKVPKKSKERSPAQSTPKKNAKNKVRTTQSIENGDASPSPIPNLRLEEKMIAEENSLRFAGKQLHPFFSSWKLSKKCQETTEEDNYCCLIKGKDKSVNIGPIHVFERDQDDVVSLDWKNWKFYEESHTSSGIDVDGPLSSNLETPVDSLCCKKFPAVLDPIGSSRIQDGTSSAEHLFQRELLNKASTTFSAISSDSKNAGCQLADNAGTEHEDDEVTLLSSGVRKSDTEQEVEYLQERSLSSYLCCTSQLENRLWTDKHRPEKAMEVCGNDESVKFMSEWLHNWYEKGHQANKDPSGRGASIMEDSDTDYDCSESDCDSGTREKETTLKNVLLVSGPAGSGKSAAIYACANEQGFEVFEVNASECRNGAIVKQRFGEILECHFLTRFLENNAQSQSKNIVKSSNAKMTTKLDNEVVEVIALIDDDNSQGDTGPSRKFVCKNSSNVCRVPVKPLILFEDVDITFQEDRGLLAAIQQIAEKAKGPVILTSNNYNPELPTNLNRSKVCFTMPSEEELLRLARVVCYAEKASIEPHFIDQLIKYCQGDIRKTIMHLQFWCQGRQSWKGRKTQRDVGPPLFDTEVGHQILPKMIPWNLPSQLSELIEKEITMALIKMNENNLFMEVIEEDFDDRGLQDNFEMRTFEKDNIAAKKKAMLSRNCSDHDCNEITVYFDDDYDLFDSSGTPVSGLNRNSRRKLNVVMSSDSEDEIHAQEFPVVKQTNNDLFLEVGGAFVSSSPSKKNCLSPSIDLQFGAKAENFVENHIQCSETANDLHAQDTCKSVDVSCVPESSLIPETEVNETELLFCRPSSSPVSDTLGDISVSYEFKEFVPAVGVDSVDESLTEEHKDFDFPERRCTLAVSPPEEVEDSLNQNIESVTREYQLMDECSRMDFNGKLKPIVKLSSCTVKNLVQESWKKLRKQHTDLRQYITSEKDASGIIKLAYYMSNLISEAELLLSRCQPLDSMELPASPEASDASCRCDEHFQMISTIASHGFDFYAKEIADKGLITGSESMVNFPRKVSTDEEVNNFVQQDISSKSSQADLCMKMCQPVIGTVGNREFKSCFLRIIQSIIPLRSHMTLRGDAFQEYLSSLCHIARSEDARLSEGTGDRKCRRGRRATRNYLSTGSLAFSTEDISLLSKSNIYG